MSTFEQAASFSLRLRAIKADNLENFDENGKKEISCTRTSFIFRGKKHISQTKDNLDKYYGDSSILID